MVSDTFSLSELAFYTLILWPASMIDAITISPVGCIPSDPLRTPRALNANTIIVECNTLDAVLQLFDAGRLGEMRHIGGMHGLMIPRCQITDLATGATTVAFVLAKDSRSVDGCHLL